MFVLSVASPNSIPANLRSRNFVGRLAIEAAALAATSWHSSKSSHAFFSRPPRMSKISSRRSFVAVRWRARGGRR
jgi:hypothetical protein